MTVTRFFAKALNLKVCTAVELNQQNVVKIMNKVKPLNTNKLKCANIALAVKQLLHLHQTFEN